MAKEKNLTTVTSVAAADFVRLVTSAGASVKATAANLAKYIVETYNGSTVAGSAQSVKSALDSLNNKMKYQELYGSSVDLNDAALNTWYWVYQSATHAPDQGALFTYGYTSRKSQMLFAYNAIYVRMYSSNIWGNWYKVTGTAVS